jgi:hypothetical protein
MQAMHRTVEQISGPLTLPSTGAPTADQFAAADLREKHRWKSRPRDCDKAAPATAVMLHLRGCYVSKAAILTIPVQSVPVENRSPA